MEAASSRVEATFVVVNLNGKAFLNGCLESVLGQSLVPDEVIVVDNGSTDDSLDIVTRNFPFVKVHRIGTNRGLTFAYAVGMALAKNDFVILSNNDLVLEHQCVEELLRFCRGNNTVVVPRFLSFSEPHYNQSFPVRFVPALSLPWSTWAFKLAQNYSLTDVAGFGMLLVRKEMVSMIDRRFRVYFSEDDFSLQVRRNGSQIIVASNAIVYHYGGGTLGKVSARKFKLFARDWALYHAKWFGNWQLLPSTVFATAVLVYRWLIPISHLKDFAGLPLQSPLRRKKKNH
jgi:GT2 family glycosyltransferase